MLECRKTSGSFNIFLFNMCTSFKPNPNYYKDEVVSFSLLFNHAKPTRLISMKLCIQIVYKTGSDKGILRMDIFFNLKMAALLVT